MAKKIYCGIDNPEKKQRRGTPSECAELKQVRYYGLKKISKDIAEEYKGIPVESELRERRLAKMMGSLRGKMEAYKEEIHDYKEEDDYKKNKKYQQAVKDLESKLEDAKDKLHKVSKKMKDFREKKKSKK